MSGNIKTVSTWCAPVVFLLGVFTHAHPQTASGDLLLEDGFENIPSSSWVPQRDGNGNIVVNTESVYGTVIFENERSDELILSGFPVGHNLPAVDNRIFYNLMLDGYGDLSFGNCLTRSYLMDESDPTRSICEANENKDLMRVWANSNPDLQHVLLKNLVVKNAFRSYNVVDGVVVQTSSALPHTDTFQTFFGGNADEDPEWLVIQDSVFKNSDNNLMITGGNRFKGFLYQNLLTTCEQEFLDDKHQRILNDYAEFLPDETPTLRGCGNFMGASSNEPALVWLVEVAPGNGKANVSNNNAPVIVVGSNNEDLLVFTRNASNQIVPHENVHRYAYIEDALADGHMRPPFLNLSCTGWRLAPSNCESIQGYRDDR